MNRNGGSVSPCSTPVVILKKDVSPRSYHGAGFFL